MSIKTEALSEKLLHVVRTVPVTVKEDDPVGVVLELMRRKQVHCVMVLRGEKLSGIFTERDYLMKVLGKASSTAAVRSYMTPDPLIGSLDETLGEVIEVMNVRGLRNLPLIDEKGAPNSLVTVSTVIRYLADLFPAQVVNRPPQPHLVSGEADGA